jgi:hypothetical protein
MLHVCFTPNYICFSHTSFHFYTFSGTNLLKDAIILFPEYTRFVPRMRYSCSLSRRDLFLRRDILVFVVDEICSSEFILLFPSGRDLFLGRDILVPHIDLICYSNAIILFLRRRDLFLGRDIHVP